MNCYWITYEAPTGERWDEGVPYVAASEEDAERQMIVNGCGGDETASLEKLREHYRWYFEVEGGEPGTYTITEADDWTPDETGFPIQVTDAA